MISFIFVLLSYKQYITVFNCCQLLYTVYLQGSNKNFSCYLSVNIVTLDKIGIIKQMMEVGIEMSKKFFFFDIDGTLAVGRPGKGYIPESAKLALKKLEEQGHFLALATGRSQAMAEGYLKEFGFENMVHDGGNGFTIHDQIIDMKPLDYEKCIHLIDECKEKDFIWAFQPDNTTRRLAPDSRFYDYTHDVFMDTVVKENVNPRDYDKIYKVYIACHPSEEEKLETLKELPWYRFHDEYIFVEPGDKSVGIKAVVDYFGGKYEDVVVFGDNRNDLSMFCDEWTSIAMGNAVDELKEKADYVTTNAWDDGIYHACKHFGWIDESSDL